MKSFCIFILSAALAFLLPLPGRSQHAFNITLLANYSDTGCIIYHDQPVIFTISLMNLKAFEDQSWNRKADLWLEELHTNYGAGKIDRATYQKEIEFAAAQKRALKIDTIGTAGKPWYHDISFFAVKDGRDTVIFPVKMMEYPSSPEIALLDTVQSYYVLYGMSPAMVVQQQPGRYEVHVRLAGIESRKVAVNILDETLSYKQQRSEDILLQFANYYLSEVDLHKALLYADSILKINPHSVGGLMLKGEISIRQNQLKEALGYFQSALTYYYESRLARKEPPEYILGMIEGVKQKLASGNIE